MKPETMAFSPLKMGRKPNRLGTRRNSLPDRPHLPRTVSKMGKSICNMDQYHEDIDHADQAKLR